MNAQEFRKACQPYFKTHPLLMSNQPGEALDGNTIRYTSMYYLLLALHGELTEKDKENFRKMYELVKVKDGLISRGPHKIKDHQAHDDPVVMAAVATFIDPKIASSFYLYGRTTKPKYFYNSNNAKGIKNWFSSWFARLPGVVQNFKLCAGKHLNVSLNLFDRFWWALDLYSTTFKETSATTGRIMDFAKKKAYYNQYKRYWICQKAIEKSNADIKKRYGPDGMAVLFAIFFRNKDFKRTHPFSVKAKGLILIFGLF